MQAAILSIGTELTTGQCLDTNSQWLSTRLSGLGAPVNLHLTVADELDQIVRAIQYAERSAELVIITGGLGPTADDLTRQAVASAYELDLVESAEALEQIQAMFARWQRPMAESNRSQALIPKGCDLLSNNCGTAPGFRRRRDGRCLIALPGVPREMRVMFEEHVAPALDAIVDRSFVDSIALRCFGISEASLGETIRDLMARGRNPSVGTTASGAVLTVRVVAQGRSTGEMRGLLDRDAGELRRRLGKVVFGEGDATLQSAVAELLIRHGATIATAESCTGGLLAKRLTDVPGSSGYFRRGYVTYDNDAKSELLGVPEELVRRWGAVSEEAARSMANGCWAIAGVDYALSITGIAGPGGGSPPEKPVGLVYIGLADHGGVDVRRVLFGEWLSREEIRDRAVKSALNLLRLRLLER